MQKRRPSRDAVFHVILSEVERQSHKASMPQGECHDRACTGMAEPFGKTQSVSVAAILVWI